MNKEEVLNVFLLAKIPEIITQEEFDDVQSAIKELLKENQVLKKQLDELQTLYNNMFKCHCNRVQVETLLEQQKAFMGYLENEINTLTQGKETFAELDAGQAVSLMTLAIALEKYKEIIGGKYEEDL